MDGENPFGPHRYIVVEGPIGVGKTTLVHRLAPRARSRKVLEIFEENPFLARFYEDPDHYAFQTELFFLLSRFRQQQELGQQDLFSEVMLSDYLFHKNLIFSGLTLEEAEWKLYLEIYEALLPQIPQPDLVVVLDAPLEVLLERIRKRGRSYESDMNPEYLGSLARRYRETFRRHEMSPVLHVETSHLDLPSDDAALDRVIREIAATTEGHRYVAGGIEEPAV